MKKAGYFLFIMCCISLAAQITNDNINQKNLRLTTLESGESLKKGLWEPIGPGGGNIKSIVINPENADELFACSAGYERFRVYFSINRGKNWEQIATIVGTIDDNPHTLENIAGDPLNPNILYALGYNKIYKSVNKGKNWMLLGEFLYKRYNIYLDRMAIDPKNPQVLYAVGHTITKRKSRLLKITLLKSTDGGKTWTEKLIGPKYGIPYDITINPEDPSIIYICGRFDNLALVLKSRNGGNSWKNIPPKTNSYPETIILDPINPAIVYIGTSWDGIFKSMNGGSSWEKILNDVEVFGLAVDPSHPNTLIALSPGICYKSFDGGTSWTTSSGPLGYCSNLIIPKSQSTQTGDLSDSRLIYCSTNGGIFLSKNLGKTWQSRDEGINAAQIESIAVSENTVYVAARGNGWFKSNNLGKKWIRLVDFYRSDTINRIVANPENPDDIIAVLDADECSGGYIFISNDGGKSVKEIFNNPHSNLRTIASDPSDFNTILAGGTSRSRAAVFKTTNGGKNWKTIEMSEQEGVTTNIFVDPTDSNRLYAVAYAGGYTMLLFRSTNGGRSWNEIGNFKGSLGADLVIDPISPSTLYFTTSHSDLYKSIDSGSTWTEFLGNMAQDIYLLKIRPDNPNVIYGAGYNGFLGYTQNGGKDWFQSRDFFGVFCWEWDWKHKRMFVGTRDQGVCLNRKLLKKIK